MKNIIIGTAGHVDHGKSSLIKALTGTDPDRLKEEKERGITIDLGFAALDLGGKFHIGFVDVPGHGRFVKNMLAGVGGIDAVLLAVAADESIMPQTREHLDICRLLDVQRGLVAITKCDLVDPELQELVRLELREFLRGSFLQDAPIIFVSSMTGMGLDLLKAALENIAGETPARNTQAVFRLPVDRCFTLHGFGTVVTGTLTHGTISPEMEVEVYPSGKVTRVRNLQVHGQSLQQAVAGQRVALNLQGVEVSEIERGMQLSVPGRFRPSSLLDARVQLLAGSPIPLKARTPIRFHHGTSELMATLTPLNVKEIPHSGEALARISLETPVLALPGDRFVIRRVSPMTTIGGGVVLDNHPRRGVRKNALEDYLGNLDAGKLDSLILALSRREGTAGVEEAQVLSRSLERPASLRQCFSALVDRNCLVLLSQNPFQAVSPEAFSQLGEQTLQVISSYHQQEPLSRGIPKEHLHSEVFRRAASNCFRMVLESLEREGKLVVEQERVYLPGHQVSLNPKEASSKDKIEGVFLQAGWKVPLLDEVLSSLDISRDQARGIVQILAREKKLVKISENLWFHVESINRLRQVLAEYRKQSDRIDVGQFKSLTGVSRKFAIPLLEYLDRERITRRMGDLRLIL